MSHDTSKSMDHLEKFHMKTELSHRVDLLCFSGLLADQSCQNELRRNLEIFSGLWENVRVGTIIF